jgi:acetyl-CoA C-acetyltransferase
MIIAPEEKAWKITNKPVWVKDWEIAHNTPFQTHYGAPLVTTASHTEAATRLFKRNGITDPRRDFSVAELYTPSTYGELEFIEGYRLCEEGEAWKLEEKGVFDMESEFPVNPSGGVLATNAISSTGLLKPLECALQLRGDAGEHQITRKPHMSFSSAWGGANWTAAHILSNTLD